MKERKKERRLDSIVRLQSESFEEESKVEGGEEESESNSRRGS